jgi:hypothetical protein
MHCPGCPAFNFAHYHNSIDLYANPDIKCPEGLVAGRLNRIEVTVHNRGAVPGYACVELFWALPGTTLTQSTAQDVLGPDPNPTQQFQVLATASRTVTFRWNPDPGLVPPSQSFVTIPLFARISVPPQSDPNNNIDCGGCYPTDFDPFNDWNAQHMFHLLPAGVTAMAHSIVGQAAGHGKPVHHTFGIVNPTPSRSEARISARSLAPTEKPFGEVLSKDPAIRHLLAKGGRWRETVAQIVLGKERVVHDVLLLNRSRAALGHFGVIRGETYERLHDGRPGAHQDVELVPGEVRQGIVSADSSRAEPGDFFVVEVRHELQSKQNDGSKQIGGLLLLMEPCEPNDEQ